MTCGSNQYAKTKRKAERAALRFCVCRTLLLFLLHVARGAAFGFLRRGGAARSRVDAQRGHGLLVELAGGLHVLRLLEGLQAGHGLRPHLAVGLADVVALLLQLGLHLLDGLGVVAHSLATLAAAGRGRAFGLLRRA